MKTHERCMASIAFFFEAREELLLAHNQGLINDEEVEILVILTGSTKGSIYMIQAMKNEGVTLDFISRFLSTFCCIKYT